MQPDSGDYKILGEVLGHISPFIGKRNRGFWQSVGGHDISAVFAEGAARGDDYEVQFAILAPAGGRSISPGGFKCRIP